MSYLADAHRDWHAVNGWRSGCPLDCAAADLNDQPEEPPAAEADGVSFWDVDEAKRYAREIARAEGRAVKVTLF